MPQSSVLPEAAAVHGTAPPPAVANQSLPSSLFAWSTRRSVTATPLVKATLKRAKPWFESSFIFGCTACSASMHACAQSKFIIP